LLIRVTIGQLLQNCFDALELASIRPKRFLLQTGAKYYGGGLAMPAFESDPRIAEPNFYYVQEDLLAEYSRKTGVGWNVVRPAFIIGAVEDAAMNSVYPLAVYAAVQKHKGEKLVWPGDLAAWEREVVQSSAWLNSYLSEFLTLHPEAGNQAFNAADACYFTYGRLWLELAGWYGIDYTLPDVGTEGFQEVSMEFKKILRYSKLTEPP
jgi:nucleoside-diphosphate-sugar epimerase